MHSQVQVVTLRFSQELERVKGSEAGRHRVN